MGLFEKFFGKKPTPVPRPGIQPAATLVTRPDASQATTAAVDPRQDPNLIRAFDAYGREVFITKDQWRTGVLPGAITKEWDHPDQLYGVIIGALNDGFRADVVAAAQHLYRTDPQPLRGACIWGIVLMENGSLADAERVFRDFMAKHGEAGVILTNLAKVHDKRGNDALAEQALWHGLEVDPNQDNAVVWYEARHRASGGEVAGQDALRRIAALPASWRAQIWLARAALQAQHLDQALALYRESLSRAGYPPPTDLLMQVSGDLGNAGHLHEILLLVEPHFAPEVHGLQVGNNLLKANFDLGKIDAVRRILDQLYAFQRPDWKETLSYWDAEYAKAKVAAKPLSTQAELTLAMLAIHGPVWLKPESPAIGLFPTPVPSPLTIAFLGGTASVATNSKRVEQQLADARGRMSRALPLFLAEQVAFGSAARTRTMIPWVVTPTPGFVLGGVPWSDEDAATYARQDEPPGDYVVITHLQTHTEMWTVDLRIVRTIDGQCLAQRSEPFPMMDPSHAIRALAAQTRELLEQVAKLEPHPFPPSYAVPPAEHLVTYLMRLEHLLAIRCSGMEGVPRGFLYGERDIIDGMIQHCLVVPGSVSVRLLMAQVMLSMRRVRPEVVAEYAERVTLLQRQHPLAEPAQSVVQGLLQEALGGSG